MRSTLRLIIGNKNYSTWSMRPWLLLTAFDLPFEEITETLADETTLNQRLRTHSPTARVPVLVDGDLTVWDSLAICEYINETHLNSAALPADKTQRAYARSIITEMHAGFVQLRRQLPMNIRARRRVDISDSVRADINRIAEIFSAAESWLCGEHFSIADCFYAPVVMRFQTYADINLPAAAQHYCRRISEHTAVQQWCEAAGRETEIVACDEVGDEIENIKT